jgi:hypothetical protein
MVFLVACPAFVFSSGFFENFNTNRGKEHPARPNEIAWGDGLGVGHGKQYFYFEGFDFEYRPSLFDGGLRIKINPAISYITDTSGRTPTYTFVGHSQGGLRALATAPVLKTQNPAEYDRLDGIITVSGIDRGIEALAGGVGVLGQKMMTDVNILWNGARATVSAFDPTFVLGSFIYFVVPRDLTEAVKSASALLWFFDVGWVPDLLAGNPMRLREIVDMSPASDYISDYITTTKPVYEMRRVQVGTRAVTEVHWALNLWGWKIFPYLVERSEPVYSYYAHEIGSAPGIRVGEEMPIGYIVGLNSNTLGMADDEADIRYKLSKYKNVFEAARITHIMKQFAFLGFLTGSPAFCYDAERARDFCANIDAELNYLKGSTENDGLVAKKNQYYPTSVHANVLGTYSEGYKGFPEYNHRNIIEQQRVREEINIMIEQSVTRRLR